MVAFHDVAAALAANGYAPVPVHTRTKRPVPTEWTHYAYREGDEHTYAASSCGALTGELVPIDVDIRHPVLAPAAEQIFTEAFGPTIRRIGAAPKVALMYRTDKPFKKLSSVSVRLPGDAPDAKPHAVEVLAQGQQILFYGIHPDGHEYTWNGIGDPLEHPIASLPTVTEDEVLQCLLRVNKLLLEHGTPVGRLARDVGRFNGADEQIAHNADECLDAIEHFPNQDLPYDDWVYFGMAIKGALGDAGQNAFDDWSSRSAKYDRDETARVWRSLAPTRIGAGTIYHHALKTGWQRPNFGVDISALLPVAPAVRGTIDWADVARNPPPPREWAIEGWLPIGSMTVLAGRGGIGKTLVMQQLASCLAMQHDFVGAIQQPRTALQWCAEDDADELKRRQIDIAQWLDKPIGLFQNKLYVEPLAGIDCALAELSNGNLRLTKNATMLWEQINDLRINVFMLDNIAHLYGGNENDRHQVTLFMNALTGICLRARCAGILAGHPAKSSESEFSGSTAWENAVRSRWYLSRTPPDVDDKDAEQDSTVRYLAKRKANYSALDCLRLTYLNGVLAPDIEPAENSPFLRNMVSQKAQSIVLAAVKKLADMSIFSSEKSRAGNFLPKLIKEYNLSQGMHRSELERSMRQLIVDGKLTIEPVGKYDNGMPRAGLVAAK